MSHINGRHSQHVPLSVRHCLHVPHHDILDMPHINVWYSWHVPHQCLTLLVCPTSLSNIISMSCSVSDIFGIFHSMSGVLGMSYINVWHFWTVLQWWIPECDIPAMSDINVGHIKMLDIDVRHVRYDMLSMATINMGYTDNVRHQSRTLHMSDIHLTWSHACHTIHTTQHGGWSLVCQKTQTLQGKFDFICAVFI